MIELFTQPATYITFTLTAMEVVLDHNIVFISILTASCLLSSSPRAPPD